MCISECRENPSLQQWFEYCSSTKKHSCPVCKQRCKADNAVRLYFQSVGDSVDPSLTQKLVADCEGNPEALRREVKSLESKVVGLGSALENQSKAFKELNEEVCHFLCGLAEKTMRKEEIINFGFFIFRKL